MAKGQKRFSNVIWEHENFWKFSFNRAKLVQKSYLSIKKNSTADICSKMEFSTADICPNIGFSTADSCPKNEILNF